MAVGSIMKIVATGVMLVGLGATMAMAGPAEDAIKARQDCMKANGKSMGVMVPMIKGEKPYDNAAVQAALAATEAACGGWDSWWGEDTKPGAAQAETWAKEAVWTDAAKFKEDGEKYGKAFGALKASADEASFKAAFGEFGGTCKDCHEEFRRPKE